jgi:hypothetical protein
MEGKMEIAIIGEGEVILRFIDRKGRTLVQEKIIVSGSPTMEARRIIALSVETTSGAMLLAPVLVRQSNPQQRVTFDREQPSRFTRKRCKEIGCKRDVASDAASGCAAPPAGALLQSDDEVLARVISEVVGRGKTDQSE